MDYGCKFAMWQEMLLAPNLSTDHIGRYEVSMNINNYDF
jgi:hypothetical protein